MNKLTKIDPSELRRALTIGGGVPEICYPGKAYAVEALTDEGNPFTFATIFKSKHGRTNMSGVGNHKFYVGSKSHSKVVLYARTVDPNTNDSFFINGNHLQTV